MAKIIPTLLILFSLSLLAGEEQQLFDSLNQYRESMGLSILVEEAILSDTAESHLNELIERRLLSHSDLEGGGVLDRYRKNGGTASAAGEILGTGKNLEQIFEAWINSSSHLEVILRNRWQRMGLAISLENGIYTVVVLFSNSLIKRYEVINLNAEYSILIQAIEDVELFFSDDYTCLDNSKYSLSFPEEEIPRLITIAGGKKGEKEISDFLYIR